MNAPALRGLRVLELGQLVASPFAGYMLAAFGAEVIKVEVPGTGDPLRTWRKMHAGTSLWWHAISRNKKSITCNLREEEGRDLVRKLVAGGIDIVVENFRPGRMEAWGLGYEDLCKIDPRVILVRISGYGQTGPYRERPGFANIAEAFGGLRYITGEEGGPPARSAASLGDTLAGLHAAYGALAAVIERQRSGVGQEVDVALYEGVLNMMESMVPEFDLLGFVRERTGARLDGVVPSNTYATADQKWVAIGANADALFRKLMVLCGREDLASAPDLAQNHGRVARAREIDDVVAAWTAAHPLATLLDQLEDAGIPAGPVNSAADLCNDPHVVARGTLEQVTLPDGTDVRMSAPVPRLSRTPPRTTWAGPPLGAHNQEIYGELLGLGPEELAKLKAAGVI